MAKATSKTDKPDQDKKPEVAGSTVPSSEKSAASAPAVAATPSQTLRVDDANVLAAYANFCRVSSTPEELILDLGLNPNPYAQGEVVVPVSQRIIMNHYTAKRLLNALSLSLQRHEQAFGVLETDVRRRVRSA